jgi:hypothetical protein
MSSFFLLQLLNATDLASQSLDIPEIKHIVNYQLSVMRGIRSSQRQHCMHAVVEVKYLRDIVTEKTFFK